VAGIGRCHVGLVLLVGSQELDLVGQLAILQDLAIGGDQETVLVDAGVDGQS
jgi:hypothetical protein